MQDITIEKGKLLQDGDTRKVILGNNFMFDYYVQNVSFARIDNITAGYSFNKILGGLISGGRISATVQNPFVFTNYKGLDPEIFGGIDGNIYPKPIVSVLGLTLNF